jgi:histidyl-tRNA synthetase
MLVGERAEPRADVAIVAEDDSSMLVAIAAQMGLRALGLTCDAFLSGSPRKRFDKAVKSGAKAILGYQFVDGKVVSRIKSEDEVLGIQLFKFEHDTGR